MHKKYLVLVLLMFVSVFVFAQPSVLYSTINSTPRVPLTDMGLFLQGRMQADQAGYQRWAFHKGTVAAPDYSQNWRISTTPNVLSFSNFLQAGYSNGANYFTGGGGVDGEINPVVIGNYYTFNVTKNAFASNDMEVIETNFNPTVISSVTQSPLAANVIANTAVAVTITMASAPAVGEFVYLRYSIDGFANASLIQASFIGNTSTVNIPCQAAGTSLSYYVFSSTETLAGINADLATFGVNSYDMATLNLNNNGGPNYSYTVGVSPTNIISYASTPYCSNSGTANVTNTGTLGGIYSSTAGLSINATTGAINLATSTAGTYVVTYTIAAAGSCSLFTATTMITITAAPLATISFGNLPFCSNGGSATVIRTGTIGGVYTSTAGLSLNASTGSVNLATSTAGTYTVNYTIASVGGCPTFSTTAPITITAAPIATINYTGSPYCNNLANAMVTRTGNAGGTYSSTAGLNINAATGQINIGSSTAGTYVVTYTIAAAGGCALFITTTSITITAAPMATINYGNLPFCSNSGSANVTNTGTTGGVYSSAAGLSLNASTGSVNLATSTAGTYTVTYTIAASGGCPQFFTSAPITITAAPNATINYSGSPYCNNLTTAMVTRTGTAGGAYSSTAGLSINPTSGDVDIANSIAGTYIVTYTVAANAGCAIYNTTTTITINTISIAPTSATANNTLICANNGSINLTANGGTVGTGGLYKWYIGNCGGNSIGTGATLSNIVINNTTTYFVRIEGACNNTTCQSVTVTVAPKPVVEITVAPPGGVTPNKPATVIATVSPVDNYTYVWTKNNTQNLNINRDRIIVNANEVGDYNVRVIAPSGCTSTSINAFVPSATSTTLFIFPSPNNGLFNVSYNNGSANFNGRTITIYDNKGARVFTQTYNNTVPFSNMKVDMRGNAAGLYFVVLKDSNNKELASGKVLIF